MSDIDEMSAVIHAEFNRAWGRGGVKATHLAELVLASVWFRERDARLKAEVWRE